MFKQIQKTLYTLLLIYCGIFSLTISIAGILSQKSNSSYFFQIIFLPVTLFFIFSLFYKIKKRQANSGLFRGIKKLFIYYSFILTSIMTVAGLIGASNIAFFVSALLFAPLTLYFLIEVIPRRRQALVLAEIIEEKIQPKAKTPSRKTFVEEVEEKPLKLQRSFDHDRRMFIKLIGSAGISIFLLSIFSGKAQGAFFGSVPGPGTVSLKDTTGAQIDPAVEHATDKYRISEVDDSTPAYYGFLDSGGAWYILKEASDGTYRYVKGSSSFSTNWTGRAGLSYDYYHNIF